MTREPESTSSPADPSIVSVRVFRTAQQIKPLRKVWDRWCDNPDSDPDVFLVSAEPDSRVIRPYVMVVYRHGQPDCILVGRLQEGIQLIKVGYAVVFRPRVRTLLFMPGAYLGNQTRENSELLVAEISRSLQCFEADCAELRQVPLDSSLSKEARSRPGFWCCQDVWTQQTHRYLQLDGSYQDYLRRLPRKQRHEAGRHARMLAKDFPGGADIRCYREEDQVGRLADDIEKVHRTSYQGAMAVGFRDNPGTRARFRALAKRNGLRACVMYLSGEPVAFFVAFKFKETLFGQYLGFDPKFHRYSPGLQVLLHSIEDSCQPDSGLKVLDLGWGDRNYKKEICNRSYLESTVFIFAPSVTGLELKAKKELGTWLDSRIKKWLASAGLYNYLRRCWQALAAPKRSAEVSA